MAKNAVTANKANVKVPKPYEDLTFSDDFMFGKTMEDRNLCREVLECLLQEPVGELNDIQTQREFRYTKDGKPIRLDVYAGNENTVYDAEMQKLNRKKLEDLELAKRSRFYQSVMDSDFLRKGQSYRKLPDGRVLFICTFDPFQKGLPIYSFTNRCNEADDIRLTDGTEKLFFNCTCKTADIPEDLRKLYDYIMDGTISNELTKKIDDTVKRSRRNEEWRSEYMKELSHDDDIREEGRELGRVEGIEIGRADGIEIGRADGIEIGRADGIEIGRADGIEIGRADGIEIGRADGIEIGRADGIEIGRADGIRLFIQDKLEDGITEDVILNKLMKLYSLTKDQANDYLNNCRR